MRKLPLELHFLAAIGLKLTILVLSVFKLTTHKLKNKLISLCVLSYKFAYDTVTSLTHESLMLSFVVVPFTNRSPNGHGQNDIFFSLQ